MTFLDCPAPLDAGGARRCGLPAEVRWRFTVSSSDGPLESVMIGCPAGHYFSGPVDCMTWDGTAARAAGSGAAGVTAARDARTDRHDDHDGRGWFGARGVPGAQERHRPGASSAPAYYLGRPASFWITNIGARRRLALRA